MDAQVALTHQFVQRVVPTEEVLDEAIRWAEQAALVSPSGFAYGKEKIRRSVELMGLSSLPSVLDAYGPPHTPARFDFGKLVGEHGLKEAIRLRNEILDQDVLRV